MIITIFTLASQVIFFKMILMKIGLYRAYIWGNSICVITSISFPITGFIFWIGGLWIGELSVHNKLWSRWLWTSQFNHNRNLGFQTLTQIFTWGSLVIELTGFSIGFMLGLSGTSQHDNEIEYDKRNEWTKNEKSQRMKNFLCW